MILMINGINYKVVYHYDLGPILVIRDWWDFAVSADAARRKRVLRNSQPERDVMSY